MVWRVARDREGLGGMERDGMGRDGEGWVGWGGATSVVTFLRAAATAASILPAIVSDNLGAVGKKSGGRNAADSGSNPVEAANSQSVSQSAN